MRRTRGLIDQRRGEKRAVAAVSPVRAGISALIAMLGIATAVTALRCQSGSDATAGAGGHSGADAVDVASGGEAPSGGGQSGGGTSGANLGGGGAPLGGSAGGGAVGVDAETESGPDAPVADCKDCAQGQTSPCKAQFEACYGDVGCQNILACTQGCGLTAADATCTNGCMASASTTSKATFLQFHLCVFCANCKAACKQYCEGLDKGGG